MSDLQVVTLLVPALAEKNIVHFVFIFSSYFYHSES